MISERQGGRVRNRFLSISEENSQHFAVCELMMHKLSKRDTYRCSLNNASVCCQNTQRVKNAIMGEVSNCGIAKILSLVMQYMVGKSRKNAAKLHFYFFYIMDQTHSRAIFLWIFRNLRSDLRVNFPLWPLI